MHWSENRRQLGEETVGSADLEVDLARLKSVERRLNQWIQLRMIQSTSSVERTA